MRRIGTGPDAIELDRLNSELRIHQTELLEQNRELREVQQRLEESRDRYADLYDFAPIGYVDLDGKGTIRGINLTGAVMLGQTRAGIVKKQFTGFLDPGYREIFLDLLKRCRRTRSRETAEVALRPRKSSSFPALLQGVLSGNADREQVNIRMTITDLSERKAAEKALMESEERFRSLVKDAMVGFFIVQDGKIVFMNPEQERLFGQLPENPDIAEFKGVHPKDRWAFLALCGGGDISGRLPPPADMRLFLPEAPKGYQEVRWVHCRSSRLSWGGREGFLVNMLDVTRTRELERIALVHEKMAVLGHMAAGIAHEIRNPLSGINIYLSSLEHAIREIIPDKGREKEMAEQCLSQLHSASAKIASVIQRVMSFSKPTPPTLEMVNVNQAIDDALELASVALRRNGVRLRKSLGKDLPLCRADLHLLSQVLVNLVTNADQAMAGMERRKRIEVSSCVKGGKIVINVSDSGPGIPPDLREKIFDPYFTTRRDGTGIGLSFSHKVVSGHGGTISVGESPLGGAEFRIELPLPEGGSRQ